MIKYGLTNDNFVLNDKIGPLSIKAVLDLISALFSKIHNAAVVRTRARTARRSKTAVVAFGVRLIVESLLDIANAFIFLT